VRFFGDDGPLPWAEDPAGDAFLSAPLTEAALMSGVLAAPEFAGWLDRVLPDPGAAAWASPEFPRGDDPGRIHLEGLLISRAWCLDAIGRALPPRHPAARLALDATGAHLEQIAMLDPTAGFGRRHWLPTFLLYLDERLRAAGQFSNADGGGQAQARLRSP
jgi:hypothetical protein